MSLTYRIKKRRLTLHWNPKCYFWPEDDFEELFLEYPEEKGYELCRTCRRMADKEMIKMAKKK